MNIDLILGECNWEWIWSGTVHSVDQSEGRRHRHGGYSRYHWSSGTVTTTSKPLSLPFFSLYLSGQCLVGYCCYIFCSIYNPTATRNFLTQPTFNACLPTNKWLQESLNQWISIWTRTHLPFLYFKYIIAYYNLFALLSSLRQKQSDNIYSLLLMLNHRLLFVINSIGFHYHHFRRLSITYSVPRHSLLLLPFWLLPSSSSILIIVAAVLP